MRSLSLQFSALVGTLTFVSQITAGTAIEPALYRGLATAAAIFLIMLLGDLAIQAVMRAHPATPSGPSKAKLRRHDSEDRPDALAA
ncbi:MAG: hypothetical protein R3282_03995 [Rhodothermales bacterium]|nr:hypothetical protein [Rhodothermales bacterium]